MENEIIYLYKECGNKQAYNILLENFYTNVFPYLKNKTKIYEFFMLETDDLYSELFEEYIKCINIYNYKKMNNFIFWSRRYLLNKCFNSYRTAKRKKREFAFNADFFDSNNKLNPVADFNNQSLLIKKYFYQRKIEKIIEKINNSNNDILIRTLDMRLKGKKFNEISETLNIKRERLYSIWYRFLNKHCDLKQ